MDCRKAAVMFAALLVGACGCASVPLFRTPGTTLDADAELTHKAPTYVAFGDFRARSAEAPDVAPEAKRQLREEASLAYLKAIEVDPKYAQAYVALARLQMAAEDHASAAQTYVKVLALAPNDATLHFELGMCHCRMKDWPAALPSMKKALELEPGNRQFATAAGLAMARAGQWDQAFALLERTNGLAKAHYDLARMLSHVGGQADKAAYHAAAAVAADPQFEPARTLLARLEKVRPTSAVSGAPVAPKAPPAAAPKAPPAPPAPEPRQPEATPKEHEASADRPIRMPPLPVIHLNTRKEASSNP
jgi:tetratricopeptide (TPR) repeat protein